MGIAAGPELHRLAPRVIVLEEFPNTVGHLNRGNLVVPAAGEPARILPDAQGIALELLILVEDGFAAGAWWPLQDRRRFGAPERTDTVVPLVGKMGIPSWFEFQDLAAIAVVLEEFPVAGGDHDRRNLVVPASEQPGQIADGTKSIALEIVVPVERNLASGTRPCILDDLPRRAQRRLRLRGRYR